MTASGQHEVMVDKRGYPTYVRLETLSDAQLGAMHRRYANTENRDARRRY